MKQAPSIGRIIGMVAFSLSCIGLLLFLWLTFGGSIPLKPEGYRFKVAFPEAATLAQEADVRMAGVNVGRVKSKELDERAVRTLVELELDDRFAPIPKDSRAILRQKTLLGETYVEITPGDPDAGALAEGQTLAYAQVDPTVELDEIFNAFDRPTREAFKVWVRELSKAIVGGRAEHLNDAFGNLSGFAVDGARLFQTLDEQQLAVQRLVKNTGVVFGALNERQGQLRELISNSDATFAATAARDDALAETFEVFPTFLDESRSTLARLEGFSRATRPLVRDLKGPADELRPTLANLARLAPELEGFFRDFDPLIPASRTRLPALERFVRGAEPLLEAAHPFFQELNPILSYFNFNQHVIAHFFANGGYNLSGFWAGGDRGQTQIGIIDGRSFPSPEFPTGYHERPFFERGNAYVGPNSLVRGVPLGAIESFDCAPAGGVQRNPNDATAPGEGAADKAPPCFVVPASLFDGRQFVKLERGTAPRVDAPVGAEGTRPAAPEG